MKSTLNALPDALSCFDMMANELKQWRGQTVELTFMSHGGGSQTSVLHWLASETDLIHLDFSMFANVSDDGTECEWDTTTTYLESQSRFSYVPLVIIQPGICTMSGDDKTAGLFDRYLARETMPVRMYRSCTSMYKIRPQMAALKYFHDSAMEMYGVNLVFRQVIGYSSDEEKRAARFVSDYEWIRPWFPLIEWGWNRERTLAEFKRRLPQIAYAFGLPERSGCWFCPFQKRGKLNPSTLEATPKSWTDLYLNHRPLFDLAQEMETTQNNRRVSVGKKPIYFYGKKPLAEWMTGKYLRVQMEFDLFGDGADTCESWGCMI